MPPSFYARMPVALAACIALLHPAQSHAQPLQRSETSWGHPHASRAVTSVQTHPATTILGCSLSTEVTAVSSCILTRVQQVAHGIAALDAQTWERLSLLAACVQASADFRLDPGLLLAIALMEAGTDQHAHNPDSTALGPFQFTEGAWLAAVHRYGARYGLGVPANMRALGVRRTASEAVVGLLRLRTDPFMSSRLAAASLANDRVVLSNSLGRAPTPVEMYLLHLLGEPSAARFIAAAGLDDGTPSEQIVPLAVASNQALFVRPEGTLSPLELADSLDVRMQQQMALANSMIGTRPGSVPGSAKSPGPVVLRKHSSPLT
jgi:hypothetical protein